MHSTPRFLGSYDVGEVVLSGKDSTKVSTESTKAWKESTQFLSLGSSTPLLEFGKWKMEEAGGDGSLLGDAKSKTLVGVLGPGVGGVSGLAGKVIIGGV